MNGQAPPDSAMRSAGHRFAPQLQSAVSRIVVGIGLRRRLNLIETRQARHAEITDPELIATWQTRAFNEVWDSATRRIRFYAEWKRRHGLPNQVRGIDELSQFPILRRNDIDDGFETIVQDTGPCHFVYSGGTTGNARMFPRGNEDALLTYANAYLGRSWAGISPGDSIVAIWGHEHLFGTSRMRQVRKVIRATKDWLINTRRLNAYRLDDGSVADYLNNIQGRPGSVIIAYPSAIRKLLDFAERVGIDGRSARIRAIIFCGETVIPRDLDRARRSLGTIPIIEYGMMETGAMAYSSPQSSTLTFFWDAFHCHATSDRELIVTSLQPMRFPLINYGTEDRIKPLDGVSTLPFRCARILGRKSETCRLKMRGGNVIEVHGELIFDVLDVIPEVSSFAVRRKDNMLDVAVHVASGEDLDAIRNRFLREIKRELPALEESAITFSWLDRELRTLAGKRQVLLRG